MGKMFCFWCETGTIPKHLREKGVVWIHLRCFYELINTASDTQEIRKILSREKDEFVVAYLTRMEEFDDALLKPKEGGE